MKAPIVFYLPRSKWPDGALPKNVEEYSETYFLNTDLSWVLQSYLRLREAGYPVQLVPDIPGAGIIVTFGGLLRLNYRSNPEQFLVSISADNRPQFFAPMHIVQNFTQTRFLRDSFHIPHWPQPGINPRPVTSGNRFTRAAFFGDECNLAPELKKSSWVSALREVGLEWSVRGQQCHYKVDYSDVDLIVAVRSFQKRGYLRKPASKLFNAWLAGVPAVLGNEFAYREQRKSKLDYIEVETCEEACHALRALAASPVLRAQMIENGFRRAREISTSAITERWRTILFEEAIPRFERWRTLSASDRQKFMLRRLLQKKIRGVRHRLLRALGQEQNAL